MWILRLAIAVIIYFGGNLLSNSLINSSSGAVPYFILVVIYAFIGLVLCAGKFKLTKKQDRVTLLITELVVLAVILLPILPPLGTFHMAIVHFLMESHSEIFFPLVFGGVAGMLLGDLRKKTGNSI